MIKIIFENQNFVICDKPSDSLSTPDRHKSDRPCLGLELQKKLQQQIFPVHRLDYEVSGLIMYAKNTQAHRVSQDWFSNKKIFKKYLALTSTQDFSSWPENVKADHAMISPEPGQNFFWKMQIQRGKRRSFESVHGDWAETKAETTQYLKDQNLIQWSLYPLTGRPHQLRLELARHGFSIVGDQLYGSQKKIDLKIWPAGGIALRAVELDLSQVPDRLGLPVKIELPL